MNTPGSKKTDLDYLLDEVITLPSLPGTISNIMRLVNDPQCSLAAVAKAISADPPLAMKTLRLVNTAYYGLRQKITTIEHAVVLLGTKVVKNLAFTATVFDVMKGGMGDFFRHSISCGMATRALIEANSDQPSADSTDEAFVFGLLHDIGKVMFEQFMPKEYEEVAVVSREKHMLWYLAEREVLGIDHALLGAKLAEKWKLPDHLIGGIAGHHELAQCAEPDLRSYAAVIAVADFVCAQCRIKGTGEGVAALNDEVWKYSELNGKSMYAAMNGFFERLPAVDELMQSTS